MKAPGIVHGYQIEHPKALNEQPKFESACYQLSFGNITCFFSPAAAAVMTVCSFRREAEKSLSVKLLANKTQPNGKRSLVNYSFRSELEVNILREIHHSLPFIKIDEMDDENWRTAKTDWRVFFSLKGRSPRCVCLLAANSRKPPICRVHVSSYTCQTDKQNSPSSTHHVVIQPECRLPKRSKNHFLDPLPGEEEFFGRRLMNNLRDRVLIGHLRHSD